MKVCAAAYRHGQGIDVRVFYSERGALAWRTSIAKEWWESEFPHEDVPPDEKIGERYFEMHRDHGLAEEFSYTMVEIERSTGESAIWALTIPTIHSNGTSREALAEELRTAGEAGRRFLVALERTAPHERDYYPQGPGAFKKAVAEHYRRYQGVQEIYNELGQIVDELA